MTAYLEALKVMDWQFQFSDDQAVWRQGTQAYAALREMQRQYDPDYSIWNQHAPKEFIK